MIKKPPRQRKEGRKRINNVAHSTLRPTVEEHQIMEHLFKKLNFKTMEDWTHISKQKIKQYGGGGFLKRYSDNIPLLLHSLYPNYPWTDLTSFPLEKFVIRSFSIENQIQKMEFLYSKFQLNSLDDWLSLAPSVISKGGGERLLQIYDHRLDDLLKLIYPNFAWEFSDRKFRTFKHRHINNNNNDNNNNNNRKKNNNNNKNRDGSKAMDSHRRVMESLYSRLQLGCLDDWLKVSPLKIAQHGGRKTLKSFRNNRFHLLCSIYPNYPFDFISKIFEFQRKKFKLIDRKREYIDELFFYLQLHTLDHFIPLLLSYNYNNNNNNNKSNNNDNNTKNNLTKRNIIKSTLREMYPNFPWDFSMLDIKRRKVIDFHRIKMDKLFIKFHLKTLDDWLQFPISKIALNRGKRIVEKYPNMEDLLCKIYPNFPWDFSKRKIVIKQKTFKSISRRIHFMDKLFYRLKLKKFDDWYDLSVDQIRSHGGAHLMRYYDHSLKNLLCCIYPSYPWCFPAVKLEKKLSNRLVDIFRKRMEKLYYEMKLKSVEEFITLPKSVYLHHVDTKLFSNFRSLFDSLSLLYPNFPWQPISGLYSLSRDHSKYLTHHQLFDHLFSHFQLTSLSDWVDISQEKILKKVGKKLLSYYNNNMQFLLRSIYPNFPWNFNSTLFEMNGRKIRSIDRQRKKMDDLFSFLNLQSLDDWILIYRFHRYGFESRKENKNKIKKLADRMSSIEASLSSLYPYYPWDFSLFVSDQQQKLLQLLSKRIKDYIFQYHITQKKDWYRVMTDSKQNFQITEILKLYFPSEEWKKSFFTLRSKKSTQRLLFASTQRIYPSHLIFENYLHPQLIHSNIYELDLFIPALQLALEYQGQHHYDDLPSRFGSVETFQYRDELKEKIASFLSIKIIHIPYWWDRSLSSLQSSLQSNNN